MRRVLWSTLGTWAWIVPLEERNGRTPLDVTLLRLYHRFP
jgi:hypothetical protein